MILRHEYWETYSYWLSYYWQSFFFFHSDAEINIRPLLISKYFSSSSLWQYLCPCMHIMSVLCLTADAVGFVSWFLVFKIQTLKVAILTKFLYVPKMCLCSLKWFFEHWYESSNISRKPLRGIFWIRVIIFFLLAVFFLISRHHPQK